VRATKRLRGVRVVLLINLLALSVILFALGWAITVPETKRLVVADIGIIAAVGLWFAGQVLRAFSPSGKSQ
jgi:hypothetical protein